jgi:hypothetical protein
VHGDRARNVCDATGDDDAVDDISISDNKNDARRLALPSPSHESSSGRRSDAQWQALHSPALTAMLPTMAATAKALTTATERAYPTPVLERARDARPAAAQPRCVPT